MSRSKVHPQTWRTLRTAQWYHDHNCTTKGYPLCWHTLTADWLLTMRNQQVLQAQVARIQRDVSDFAGVIDSTIASGHLMPPEIVDLNDYQVSDWPSLPEGEERQAQEVVLHSKSLFAHPAVQAISWWDFRMVAGSMHRLARFGRINPVSPLITNS